MSLVADVMTRSFLTVTPDAPYKDVVRLMLRHRAGAVLVVDRTDQRLVGIVTEADLLGHEAFATLDPGDLALLWEESSGWGAEWVGRALALRAGDLMSHPILSVSPRASVAEAARLMLSRRVKHLPVIDGSELKGMISRSDLLTLFDRADAEIGAEIAEALDGPAAVRVELVDVADGVATVAVEEAPERDASLVIRRLAGLPGVVAVRSGRPPAPGRRPE